MKRVIDLGWCMARLDTDEKKLTIVSASYGGEQSNYPAESVSVYGEAGLKALRDALNVAYPEAEGELQ